MISPDTRVQIRGYFYAEHWKIGTPSQALDVHPDTVRRAIEVERFQHAGPLRPSIVDPYLPFVREVLEQHPRLRATRLYQMIRDRGYSGSVEQLRRVVSRLRPQPHEAYLRPKLRQAAELKQPASSPRISCPVLRSYPSAKKTILWLYSRIYG